MGNPEGAHVVSCLGPLGIDPVHGAGRKEGLLRLSHGIERVLLTALLMSVVLTAGAGAALATDRGKEFLRTGQVEKAKSYYEEWLAKDPESSDAIAGMGSVQIAYAEFDEAMDSLEAGLAEAPEHYELNLNLSLAYYYKARDLADRGRGGVAVSSLLRDAVRSVDKAIKIEAERFEGYQTLGIIQQFQSEFDASIKSLKTATILKPDDAYTWYQLGESQRFNENYEDAAQSYGRAAESFDGGYYEAYRKQGLSYLFLEDEPNAADSYVKAINISPEIAAAWEDLWNVYAAKKKFTEAIAVYNNLTRKHPRNAYIHLLLGSVHSYDENSRQALVHFKKALDLAKDPNMKAGAYYQLGLTYNELLNEAKAIDAMKRSLMISPDFEDPISILSSMARKMSESGDFSGASKILEFLADFKKTDGFIWSDLGLVYRDWRKYKKAETAYAKAVKFEPNDAQILNDYAVVLDYHFDRIEEAFKLYVRALELEANIDAMQNLTRLYIKRGKYKEAVEMAERALEVDSGRAIIRQMLEDAKRNLAPQ